MVQKLKAHLERDDEQGFTLIELMVVVLIIAILMAIAIPTFLGARNSANARAAQSDLRNAVTAEQTYWTNNQAWGTSASTMQSLENALSWSSASVKPGNNIEIGSDATNGGVILTAASNDGNCYSEEVINQPASGSSLAAGTYYYQTSQTSGACSTPTAPSTTPTATSAGAKAGTWATGW